MFKPYQTIRDALKDCFADVEEEHEDTPDEKIIEDFKTGFREALTGQAIPADEALMAIRSKLGLS